MSYNLIFVLLPAICSHSYHIIAPILEYYTRYCLTLKVFVRQSELYDCDITAEVELYIAPTLA